MNPASPREALEQLRNLLSQLVDMFELDDLDQGLVGVVSVIGGTFMHPLTREPIGQIKVYGAGADRVKIAEPKFLRSLPTVTVAGLTHPSQLCAGVAKALSGFLGELGKLRNQTQALGLNLDLEHDVLHLRGKAEIDEIPVEIISRHPDKLVLMVVGEHSLPGKIPLEERTLTITGDPAAQKETLAALVRSLDERVRRTALEDVERKLGLDGQPPEPKPAPVLEGGWGEPAPPQPEPPQPEPPQPEPEPEPTKQEEIPTAPPAAQPAPPPSLDTQSFVSVTGEVLELTETVEATGETEAISPPQEDPPPEPAPEQSEAAPAEVSVATPPPEESMGALNIKKLHDVLGNDAEISGFGGKLRLVVPLKVVQGLYTFYLEQRGPTQFKGFLISPQGTRHAVEFDLRHIEDIKQVFDRVVLGRQDFV
jgi:pyruvate/2-oxoglutarate dehydrogenase complex dihydrolipoamide acyltransferase (E2) component